MKISTWNINGIKARLPNLERWLKEADPDIACLQEIKSIDENFPAEVFEGLGYNVAVHGQKSFNGVAIFSKRPFDEVSRGLPALDGEPEPSDEQARYLEAVIPGDKGIIRIASLYLPNGNPVDSEKYPYKLSWMARLKAHAERLLAYEEPLVLAGDYNIIPTASDAYNPESWAEDALFRPESRRAYHELLNIGLTSAFEACQNKQHAYTFWDYQKGAWAKDHGLRIDHHLLSAQAVDRLQSCTIERMTRGWEKPSDHVPVTIEVDI